MQTGKVIEFRNEEIENLQRRVAEELGFELVDHRLELYGVPKAAQKRQTLRRDAERFARSTILIVFLTCSRFS